MRANDISHISAAIVILFFSITATAQQDKANRSPSVSTTPNARLTDPARSDATERERLLLDRIENLERRLAELESRGREVLAETGAQPTDIRIEPAADMRYVKGDIAYLVNSGTNAGFGTRCQMTDIGLWMYP